MTPREAWRDYDADPERFSLVATCGLGGDSHLRVAGRLARERRSPVLDIGCGRGRLAEQLPAGTHWVGVDTSVTQLRACRARPVVAGDAIRLPFRDDTFAAATALWMLYHVPEPGAVLREVRRVLRPGGVFIACTDSRADAPELVAPRDATPFDAEDAERIVSAEFAAVEVEPWQTSLLLENEADVGSFLRAMQISRHLSGPTRPPLTVTKWGFIVRAYKPGSPTAPF